MTFFWIFSSFFEKFWMIPYDKYTWEDQIFILSFITCFLQMKSTIKLNFSKFELWWKNQSNDLSLIRSATVLLRLPISPILKIQWFPLSMSIHGQKALKFHNRTDITRQEQAYFRTTAALLQILLGRGH